MNAAEAAWFFASLLAAGAVLYWHLRHVLLTVLAVSVPALPTAFWAMNRDPAVRDFIFAAAAFGATAMFLIVQRMARAVCDGRKPHRAMATALGTVALAVAAALSAMLVPALAIGGIEGLRALGPASACLIVEATWIGVAPWLAVVFPFSEDFIASANRAREIRRNIASRLGVLCETRWALSIAGVALILATIALFRVRDTQTVAHMQLYGLAAVSLVFAAGAVLWRDWRLAFALALSLGLAGLWLAGFSASALPVFALSLALAALPILVFGRCWAGEMRTGSRPAEALARAIVLEGPALIACALFVLLLGLGWSQAGMHSALLALAGAWIALGLVAFAAFGAGLHALAPRYRSVEEVFGKK